MANKKIPTWLGAVIIIIFTATVGVFLWRWEKKYAPQVQAPDLSNFKQIKKQPNSRSQQDNIPSKQSRTNSTQMSACANQNKPEMLTLENETNKSPNQLVEDFYNWYIKSNNYWSYLYAKHQNDSQNFPVNLAKESIFLTPNYKQRILSTGSGGDPIFCTQDVHCIMIKNYNNAKISGDNAEVDILRGYLDSYADQYTSQINIEVILKKIDSQWKIDNIICGK